MVYKLLKYRHRTIHMHFDTRLREFRFIVLSLPIERDFG